MARAIRSGCEVILLGNSVRASNIGVSIACADREFSWYFSGLPRPSLGTAVAKSPRFPETESAQPATLRLDLDLSMPYHAVTVKMFDGPSLCRVAAHEPGFLNIPLDSPSRQI